MKNQAAFDAANGTAAAGFVYATFIQGVTIHQLAAFAALIYSLFLIGEKAWGLWLKWSEWRERRKP